MGLRMSIRFSIQKSHLRDRFCAVYPATRKSTQNKFPRYMRRRWEIQNLSGSNEAVVWLKLNLWLAAARWGAPAIFRVLFRLTGWVFRALALLKYPVLGFWVWIWRWRGSHLGVASLCWARRGALLTGESLRCGLSEAGVSQRFGRLESLGCGLAFLIASGHLISNPLNAHPIRACSRASLGSAISVSYLQALFPR